MLNPYTKLKLCGCPVHYELNSFTLRYEQTRPMKEGERRHEIIFAQVKHFIMTNEKHMACFSEASVNSKY